MADWVRAEHLYREGELSVREIARREDLSEGAVRKRAKTFGWERKKAAPVRTSPKKTVAAQSSGTHESAEQGFPSKEAWEMWSYGPFLTGHGSYEELEPLETLPQASRSRRSGGSIDPTYRTS
jgi:transposase